MMSHSVNGDTSQVDALLEQKDELVEAALMATHRYLSFCTRVSSSFKFWDRTKPEEDKNYIEMAKAINELDQGQINTFLQSLNKGCSSYRQNFFGTLAWLLGTEGSMAIGSFQIKQASDSLSSDAQTGILFTFMALAMLSLAGSLRNIASYGTRNEHVTGICMSRSIALSRSDQSPTNV